MTNVQPFRGLRYEPAQVGDWAAQLGPPYDIVDAEQTAALKASSPHQIAHIETATSADQIDAAAQLLREWRRSGVLVQDDEPSFYLHEQRMETPSGRKSRHTLFAAVELSEWGVAGVMGHERTMPGPRATRSALRSVVGADVSPLMAFVPDPDHRLGNQMDDAHVSPIVSEGSDAAGDQHILRRISERALVQSFTALLAERNIYMADGHHRYESALAARDERPASNFVLMGILRDSDDGLNVGATHRVIHADVPADLPARLAASFNVADTSPEALDSLEPGSVDLQPTDAPSAIPATVPSAWRKLAPAILQYAILEPLLGIGDQELAGGQAVSYTHYVSDEAVRNGASAALSCLTPADRRVLHALQRVESPRPSPARNGNWRNELAPAILQYAILEPLLGIGDQELAGGQAVQLHPLRQRGRRGRER